MLLKDMADPEIDKMLISDIKEARKVALRGVPTLFLNGKRLNNYSLSYLQQQIKTYLEKGNKK